MASPNWVRVIHNGCVVVIVLAPMIQTYWDIAKAGTVEHLGMTLLEAHIPSSALSLYGPVAGTDDLHDSVIAALKGLAPLSLARMVDRTNTLNGTWFLLEIQGTAPRMLSGENGDHNQNDQTDAVSLCHVCCRNVCLTALLPCLLFSLKSLQVAEELLAWQQQLQV
jgi:hypothetical protein